VPDDQAAPPEYLGLAGDYDPASKEFAQLRELLLGAERRQLAELKRRLDTQELDPDELAERLPEAIAVRAARDRQLARALAPTIESAISESVRRNPREIATAIFPVLGPAIRKALAEAMAGLVESINRAVEHTFSLRGLKWRLEAWRTGTPYAQIVIKHALVYRVEQAFLVHAETGLLLAHAAASDLKVDDADLISGMLTAIQDFVADSFQQREGGRLRSFSVGELTVFVEPGPLALLAIVVRGQPPESLLPKLQERLETIHLHFAAAFADFSGETAPFAAARPLLEECLETVLSTDRGRTARPRAAWLRWAIPLVLLAAIPVFLMLRSQRRFAGAVARLQAEPGIEILEARRNGGAWRFRGLKDPLAAEPAAILASLDADTTRLDARWTPYLSLEPSLVVARSRQALSAPPGIALRLGRDTLYATGSAPLGWIARAQALPVLPAGVAQLDLSQVEATLPPELAALRNEIEARMIPFEIGSAVVTPTERGALEALASVFRRLRAATGDLGYEVALELMGRTDATGSDATNQSLSQSRVDAVRAILVRSGLPAGAMLGTALGSSTPLSARGRFDQPQANRSVTFTVKVGPATPAGGGRS
jgi:outer membrane protein OmpA-like peptidoglycan-associated protein